MPLQIAILTISDRAAAGAIKDEGGPAVEGALTDFADTAIRRRTVPDERTQIAGAIKAWADDGIDIILTTGGTGLGPRDVTPEATLDACDRPVPGIAESIRAASLSQTPMAMISRGVAATRGSTLVINLPGSPRGAAEAVAVVLPVLRHAVSIMHGGKH